MTNSEPNKKSIVPASMHPVRVAAGTGGVGTAILMLLISGDVFARLIRGRGIAGALEISEILLAAVVFLGMASAERHDVHVSTEIVSSRLPKRVRNSVWLFFYSLVFLLFGVMSWKLWLRAVEAFRAGEVRYGIAEVPIWPARFAVALGAVLLTAEVLRRIYIRARQIRSDRPRSDHLG